MTKPNYADLDDITKIRKQWRKASRFYKDKDWSAAMARATTATEIAANHAIRLEYGQRSTFDSDFVDEMLTWANGVSGKLSRLLTPLHANGPNVATINSLKDISSRINRKRNEIVHSGHFMNKAEADALIGDAKLFVETLIRLYDAAFSLPDIKS